MILKFSTMISGKPSWSMVSNIEDIDYRRIEKEVRQDKKFAPDYYVCALDDKSRIDESNQDYVCITAFRKNKTAVVICSNLTVYLLNDEGRTIEHIN